MYMAGASEIKKVEDISENTGIILKVKDVEDNIYFLGFSELCYLEIIRKNLETGESIYVATE